MEILGATIILIISWLTGFLVLRAAGPFSSDADTTVQVGYGYFLGLLLTAVFLKIWSLAGMGVTLTPALLSLMAIAALSMWWIMRKPRATISMDTFVAWWRDAPAWKRAGLAVLGALIAFRIILLGLEVGLRPLFPWDAWMHWSPKARVWMESGEWARFVSRGEWLALGGEDVYTIRNWRYPEFVPLIQVWATLPAGRWHEIAFGIPWIGAALAFAPAVYGQARLLGLAPLGALAFAWVLMSFPILNVHVALPGYADLWMGIFAGLAAASLLIWSKTRRPDQLALALLFGVACAWIKIPGMVWMLILIPALLAAYFPVRLTVGLIGGMLAAVLLLLLAGGLDIRIPGAGPVVFNLERIHLPVIGEYRWIPQSVGGELFRQLFTAPNWHLGWYLAAVGLMSGLVVCLRDRTRLTAFLLGTGGLAFLFVALLLTRRGVAVEHLRTTHRAFLQAAPLVGFCLLALLMPRNHEGHLIST